MEYTQMTLTEWVDMKQKLRQELLGVKQSFVRIGYALRKIDDQRLYEQDGYKSVAEFAKAEYGLESSTVSRFMAINREYSVDGYSERIRPEYLDLGRSQLEEMLKLPEGDRQMIQPETPRDDIRELKKFNREEPAAGEADDLRQLIREFYRDNPEILNAVFSESANPEERTDKWFAETVNPSGNRSYRKGMYFLMMYEERIAVKKFGASPQDMTWGEFRKITEELFAETAAGPRTWEKTFGEPEKSDSPEPEEEMETGEEAEPEEKEEPAEEERKSVPESEVAPAQKSAEIQEKSETEEPETPVENVEKEVENLPKNSVSVDEIEGQDSVEEHPEWLPEGYEKPEPAAEQEKAGDWRLIGQVKAVFAELKQNMAQQDYNAALENGRKFVEYLEQLQAERSK